MSETTTIAETGTIAYDTITTSGTYILTAEGGIGGDGFSARSTYVAPGGEGAVVTGTFYLTAGTTLEIVVGGQGGNASGRGGGGGGGGGGFIYDESTGILLEAAGGGGGAGVGVAGFMRLTALQELQARWSTTAKVATTVLEAKRDILHMVIMAAEVVASLRPVAHQAQNSVAAGEPGAI